MLIRKITINTTPFQTEPLQSTFNPPAPLAPPRDVSVRTPLPFANQAACAQLRPAQLQPALPTSSLSPVAWWHVNKQQFKMPMHSEIEHKQRFKMSSENKQTTVQNAMEFRQQLGLWIRNMHMKQECPMHVVVVPTDVPETTGPFRAWILRPFPDGGYCSDDRTVLQSHFPSLHNPERMAIPQNTVVHSSTQ